MKFHLLTLVLIASIIAAPTKRDSNNDNKPSKDNNKSYSSNASTNSSSTNNTSTNTPSTGSTSTGSASGSGSGTGATFGSLAYTTIGDGANATGGATMVQGSVGTAAPIASSGVTYSAGTGGGATYGSVAPNSNYSTNLNYQSTSGTSMNAGTGGSFGFANDQTGISISYGGAISRDPTTGTILSGGIDVGIGSTSGTTANFDLGGTITLPPKKT
ncbi:hypothetical protein K502DRAFT_69205 [Neoconidiobolus thromboides FSU 785]|nr:hypothetical protein K502DRAFT_69205 [Neoconidiobolus thromboides FSU 785]